MGNWWKRLVCLALAAALCTAIGPMELASNGSANTSAESIRRADAREAGPADDASKAASSAPRVLRVAFPETEGISTCDAEGQRSGVLYDWLVEIAKYTGWEYEFIDGDIDDLVSRAETGDIDIVGGMYYREQLDEVLEYTRFPIGSNYALLICQDDRDDLSAFDIRTLEGKSIGVFENAKEKTRRLENFLDFNGVHCRIVPFDVDGFATCLEDGAVDVLLGSDVQMRKGCKVVAEFEGEPYYISTAEGSPLIEELDDAMAKVLAADPSFSNELYAKHFASEYRGPIAFSEEDRAYVGRDDPVSVAVVDDQYPLYYQRDGSYQGIVKDVFDLFSERTGLKFRFVHGATYEEALGLVASGEAEIMGGFMDDVHAADGLNLALTKCYASLDEVVLRNKQSLGDGDEQVFAQIEGRSNDEHAKGARIVRYNTYEDCLDAVNAGRADFTCMPASFAESLFVERAYGNVTPANSDHRQTDFSVAFPVPVDADLYSVVSKAVNSLTDEEIDSVYSRNAVPINGRSMTLESFVSENPLLVVALSLVLCLLVGAVAIVMSVSKVHNRTMEMKLEKAEETGRARSEFLSRMSHEIRTPMNAIIGLSNVASLSGEATPSIRASLEKINTSAQFLLALVNDILDMSKIENNKMCIEPAPMSLGSLAERLQSMFDIQAESKGLTFEACCDVHGTVVCDDVRLQQVLANLLSNALKFTDEGGVVSLVIQEVARDEERVRVRFAVCDDGAGIDEDDLERIFVSFEQASENHRNAQGTGLGLAISSNLVRLMGGRLHVESAPGCGSEFSFELELPLCEEPKQNQESLSCAAESKAGALEGVCVLLAEDNDLNAEIAMALLEMEGVEVERASDGREAVDLFAASELGRFDVVLMDVKMPVMDGLEASVRIRALERDDARTVPIVALTANTFKEDREDAAAAGMDAFVPKPFDAQQLYGVLSNLVPPRN